MQRKAARAVSASKNRPATARAARARPARAALESLETRTLFSTINWVNEGNDSFIFFGAHQNVARDIVRKAISDWERVIVNFNYGDTGPHLNNTFNLTVNAASMPFAVRGSAQNTGRDDATDRKPTSATVTLDNDGGGLGWYFDPDILDDGEYTHPVNLWTANVPFPGGPTGSDFYRTVVHEIGHALGITLSSNLKLAQMAVDSGVDDPLASNPTRLFTVNTFGTPAPEYTLTAGHLWEGDGPGGITHLSEHPNDLMNEGRTVPGGTNRRQLISDTDALLLKEVYNYTIELPSKINTFAANLNAATGVLTINGNLVFSSHLEPFHLPNDFIDIEFGGLNITVELADGSVASEKIFEFQVNSIVVNTGIGNDTVEINGLPAGKSVTVNLGEGSDAVIFGGEGRFVSSIQSNVTVNGGPGEDGVVFRDDNNQIAGATWTINAGNIINHLRTFTFNDVQTRAVHPTNHFNNTFLVNSVAEGTTVRLQGNAGGESFDVGNNNITANIRGNLHITGGGGSDTLHLRDLSAPAAASWNFNNGFAAKDGAPPISYQSIEGINVHGGAHNDEFKVFAPGVPISVSGNAGNDTFYISSGDLDQVSRVTVSGGTGDDLLVVDDSADAGNDQYLITTGSITKPGNTEGFQAIVYNTQIGLETERTILIANHGSNTISVDGGRGLEIKANGGHDTIVVNDHVPGSAVTIEAGTGLDVVDLNTDGIGSVTARFRDSEDLSRLFIRSGAALSVAGGTSSTIDVHHNYVNDGLLDLNDNAMIVRSGHNLQFWRSLLASGYNGGAWNGTSGITSTFAAQSPDADAIGYATATQLGRSSFNEIPISGNDVVLSRALQGDANLDGIVNLADFNRLAANFGESDRVWSQGDFNYDGIVNLADFNRLAANFGQSVVLEDLLTRAGSSQRQQMEGLV